MTPAEVVEAHAGTTWTAASGGFAPGFFSARDQPALLSTGATVRFTAR